MNESESNISPTPESPAERLAKANELDRELVELLLEINDDEKQLAIFTAIIETSLKDVIITGVPNALIVFMSRDLEKINRRLASKYAKFSALMDVASYIDTVIPRQDL